jgi:hypothetical protein
VLAVVVEQLQQLLCMHLLRCHCLSMCCLTNL